MWDTKDSGSDREVVPLIKQGRYPGWEISRVNYLEKKAKPQVVVEMINENPGLYKVVEFCTLSEDIRWLYAKKLAMMGISQVHPSMPQAAHDFWAARASKKQSEIDHFLNKDRIQWRIPGVEMWMNGAARQEAGLPPLEKFTLCIAHDNYTGTPKARADKKHSTLGYELPGQKDEFWKPPYSDHPTVEDGGDSSAPPADDGWD